MGQSALSTHVMAESCAACQELLAPECCRVDGQTWDLIRPLEGDCQLELLDFEHPLGKDVRVASLLCQHPAVVPACRGCSHAVTPAPCSTAPSAAAPATPLSSCWAPVCVCKCYLRPSMVLGAGLAAGILTSRAEC